MAAFNQEHNTTVYKSTIVLCLFHNAVKIQMESYYHLPVASMVKTL